MPLPDYLSVDPRSPHHDAAILERDIGVRFNVTSGLTSRSTASAKAGSRFPPAGRWIVTASRCC
jgi:hypothetical protein